MENEKKMVRKAIKRIKRQLNAEYYFAKKSDFIKKQAKKMSKKMTWPEKEFLKLMKQLKIEVELQKVVGGKIYDFYEPNLNILFEIDGNYYHGDENLYEEMSPMQKRNKKNDTYKNVLAKGLGYRIERIWESDLKNNYSVVKKRMMEIFDI